MKAGLLTGLLTLLLVAACASPSPRGQLARLPASGDGIGILFSASDCRSALAEASQSLHGDALEGDAIELLSWNIQKTRAPGWDRDLPQLSDGKQLVLLQEATDVLLGHPLLPRHRALAPGYETVWTRSGVATFSSAPPDVICHLQATEPLLRTPKATHITRYSTGHEAASLVVANIHMINFTLDITDYAAQLDELEMALSAHRGPLIVAGDFNTWTSDRYRLLTDRMRSLGATPVSFSDDQRSRFLGARVDHVFVTGLDVESATTHAVESSDHNPISLRLSLPPP